MNHTDIPKQHANSGVVLMNPFRIPIGEAERFEKGWKDCAEFLKTQDGFIKTYLHKALDLEKAHFQYVNYAIWENPVKFQQAIKAMREQGIDKDVNSINNVEFYPSLYKVHLEM
ncbi:hypothetical protein ABK040_012443 [Willaertia magna]